MSLRGLLQSSYSFAKITRSLMTEMSKNNFKKILKKEVLDMDNKENTVMTEEEIREDPINQMTEAEDDIPSDQAEISDDGGIDLGTVAVAGGVLAGLVTGGIILGKKIKAKKAEKAEKSDEDSEKVVKPNFVKKICDDVKSNVQRAKEKNQTVKEIKARAKDEIKAVKHPVNEKVSESEGAENVDNKDTSKKK